MSNRYPYTGCGGKYKVPAAVKSEAQRGLKMREAGFAGGTSTGWSRARQLATCDTVSANTIRIMKAWFSRHGPDAKNGGTSKPGYNKWVRQGRPMTANKSNKNIYRGAVAWLIWGGDPAYEWVKSISL